VDKRVKNLFKIKEGLTKKDSDLTALQAKEEIGGSDKN